MTARLRLPGLNRRARMEIGGIVLCWFLFGASHMALSSLKLRPKRVGVLGDPGVTLAIRWFHSSLFGGA
ncbi:MAG: hypothetical protein IIA30_09250 [Myxococcales bacterium]|nr:hypothetical protein [Myxococcales bacterium]